MRYVLNFEITNQSGNLFSHFERYTISGLTKVRVRERKAERFIDWSGTVERFRASSSRPFVVCIISDHTTNDAGGIHDLSFVKAYEAEAIEDTIEVQQVAEDSWRADAFGYRGGGRTRENAIHNLLRFLAAIGKSDRPEDYAYVDV